MKNLKAKAKTKKIKRKEKKKQELLVNSKLTKVRKAVEVVAKTAGGVHGVG